MGFYDISKIFTKVFRGTAPRIAARKLDNFGSQIAANVDLWSKELRSLRDNIQVDIPTKTGTLLTIFKLSNLWLTWNEIVNVARSPISTGDDDRIYYSGHYNAKSTDEALAQASGTDYPTNWYRLGLPTPENAVTVGDTGGTGANSTRSYVYTFVTAWGEEGPPSTPSADNTAPLDATWNLTAMDVAPLNTGVISNIVVASGIATFTVTADHFLETGDYNDFTGIVGTGDLPGAFNDVGPLQITRIDSLNYSVALAPTGAYTSGGTWTREAPIQVADMTKRIYRTVSGQFRFVAEVPVADTTYNDTILDSLLGEPIPTTLWDSPPPDIKGLITLPNGSMAGFVGNKLYFSELFVPHAYPEDYSLTFAYDIVAIAASGNSVVVATVGIPYVVTGDDPATMTPSNLEVQHACVSERSMVSVMNGAIFASPDGLVYVPVAGMPSLITKSWFKEVDWRKLNPSSMHCYKYDDRYYAVYTGGGTQQNEDGLIVFDPAEQESTVTTLTIKADCAHNQLEDDTFYFLEDGVIKEFNKGGSFQTFTWKSKKFTMGRPLKFKACQVKFSAGEGLLPGEIAGAIASALATLESEIFFPNGNPLTPDFDKQSVSGAFGGYTPGAYAVGGGPYHNATKDSGESKVSVSLKMISNETAEKDYVVENSKPFRVNVGKLSDIHEFQVSGKNATVHEVNIAETIAELAEQ